MSQISAGSTGAIVFPPPILSPDPVTSPLSPLCGRSLRLLRQTKGGLPCRLSTRATAGSDCVILYFVIL